MIHRTTRWLLFLVGISLPLTDITLFTVGPLIFSLNKALAAALLGWAAIFWLVTRRSFPSDRKVVWLLGLVVAMVISLLVSFLSGLPFSSLVVAITSLGSIVLFYFLLVYVTVDFRSLDALLVGYLIGVVLTTISIFLGYGIIPGDERTGGLGGDPNHYSYDTAVALAIALLYFTTAQSAGRRLLLGGFGMLAVAGIMATLSRSGAVAAAAVFGLWMYRFRRFDVLRIVIPVGLLGAAIMFFASPTWTARMTTIADATSAEADASVVSRFVVGEYAIRAFISSPIFGVGYTRFGAWGVEQVRKFRQSGRGDVLANTATGLVKSRGAIHNSYLHVAAEMGIIGLVSYITFLALAWNDYTRAFRTARKFPDDPVLSKIYIYAIFLQVAYFATLIDNLFLSSLRFKSIWLVLSLSTVMLHLMRTRLRELSESPETAPLPEVPPLPGLSGPSGPPMPAALSPGRSNGVPGRPG